MKSESIILLLTYFFNQLTKWEESEPESTLEATLKCFFGKKVSKLVRANVIYSLVNNPNQFKLTKEDVEEIGKGFPEIEEKIRQAKRCSQRSIWNP